MVFEYNGAKLYYELRGEGAPLVFLHGWGCDMNIFDKLTAEFSAFTRALTLDFPGHGKSPEPPAPWSVSEYAELTAVLLRSENIVNADIIAHSFGGRVALLLASEYPELVGRMLLTGCAGIPPKPDAKKTAKSRRYARLKKLADNRLTRALFHNRVDAWREALIQKFGSADYKALSPSMRATFNRVISQDLSGCLPKIKSPTRLVWGVDDAETPIWMGEKLAREIPNASIIKFQGCGHFAFIEQHARFAAVAREFLK